VRHYGKAFTSLGQAKGRSLRFKGSMPFFEGDFALHDFLLID
jgi:hypothetical protein